MYRLFAKGLSRSSLADILGVGVCTGVHCRVCTVEDAEDEEEHCLLPDEKSDSSSVDMDW